MFLCEAGSGLSWSLDDPETSRLPALHQMLEEILNISWRFLNASFFSASILHATDKHTAIFMMFSNINDLISNFGGKYSTKVFKLMLIEKISP